MSTPQHPNIFLASTIAALLAFAHSPEVVSATRLPGINVTAPPPPPLIPPGGGGGFFGGGTEAVEAVVDGAAHRPIPLPIILLLLILAAMSLIWQPTPIVI